MVNIKEIAKKTGVSISTVSRAMRPSTQHLVKSETLRQIQQVVKKEGYVPQRAAINLVKKRTGFIGIAIPYFVPHIASNDYFSMMVSGIMNSIIESEFDLRFILLPEGDFNKEQFNMIRARQIDGLILSGWPTITHFHQLIKTKIPMIVLNDYSENIQANFVYADQYQGGYLAGKHFLSLGYDRLAVTTAEPEWFPDMDARIEGFKAALKEAGYPLDHLDIFSAGVMEETGYRGMLKKIESGTLPRAIFFQNDISAIGALKALKEKKINCPEEVAIIGFDNIRLNEYVSPKITTIEQPIFEMGKQGAEILMGMVADLGDSLIRKKLPVKLVVRESCGGNKS